MNKTTFELWLNRLAKDKQIIINQTWVEQFRDYANKRGVYPCGGAILPNDMRVLYLD